MLTLGCLELGDLKALFNQEINFALGGPQKAKYVHRIPKARATRMQAKGWIEPETLRVGRDRFGGISISCWRLTDDGRFLVCRLYAGEDE